MKGSLQFAIVVVAHDHNPTILNPDFLRIQKIVPEDWGWKLASPPLMTPPFSHVTYDSNVRITVEPNKFQIIDDGSPSAKESRIGDIASGYVRALPHTRYASVGNNFLSLIDYKDPSNYVRSRFLKSGAWDKNLQSVGLKLAFPMEGGRILLSIDAGSRTDVVDGKNVDIDCLFVNSNFDRPIIGDGSPEKQILAGISNFEDDFGTFERIVREIVGIE